MQVAYNEGHSCTLSVPTKSWPHSLATIYFCLRLLYDYSLRLVDLFFPQIFMNRHGCLALYQTGI